MVTVIVLGKQMKHGWWNNMKSPQFQLYKSTWWKYIWITLCSTIYRACLLAHYLPYTNQWNANKNRVNGRSLLRGSTTTSCQMTVQWPVSLIICASHTVLNWLQKTWSKIVVCYKASFLKAKKMTRSYHCYYGSCFIRDYKKYFAKCKLKYSKNTTFYWFFIRKRNTLNFRY